MTIRFEGLLLSSASMCLSAAFLVASLALFLLEELGMCCDLSFIFFLTTGDTCDMVAIMMHRIPLVHSLDSHLVQ